jgi:ABC-type multidrug transport system fused ATPase/permease subunit
MTVYQFQVSVSLLAASAFSGLLHILFRPKEEKIALPISESEELVASHDPFDVTKPEDVIPGIPLQESEFWLMVKYRKIAMAVLLGSVCAINAIGTGFATVNEEQHDILSYSFSLASSVYSLILVVLSINWTSTLGHTHYITHLSLLSAFDAVVLLCSVILPSSPPPTTAATPATLSSALSGLWIAEAVIYSIVCVIAFTTPTAPRYHFPPKQIYSLNVVDAITNQDVHNVCGSTGASLWDMLLFSYSTKVVMLGNTSEQLEVGDLPVVPADMRSTYQYSLMKAAIRRVQLRIRNWTPPVGSGWNLAWQMASINLWALFTLVFFSATSAILFYVPYYFLQRVVRYLENDPDRKDIRWGLIYAAGLFTTGVLCSLLTGQLWSIATTTIQVRMKIQLNSVLYRKTLVRKDVASSASSKKDGDDSPNGKEEDETTEDDFSSKAQVMNLMTTDVDHVSDFAWHMFTLIDAPIELVISTVFLYNLLGVSCFVGLAVTLLFLPLNYFAGKIVVDAQDNLMKARDERVSLMNEILAGIRMLKFMAWERSFEKKVLKVRAKELRYQKLNFTIETLWNGTWNALPILVTLVSFWHFTVVRGLTLTPSIAFTSIAVFDEMKFALSALPETFVNMLQSFVSLRRIEKYLNGAEVKAVPSLEHQSRAIAFQSATVTWPQDRARGSQPPSVAPTPRQKFILSDLSLNFPLGELSLVCGKLGSGKTLLLLSLLGEADLLAGQVLCPRSPPDAIASFDEHITPKDWVIDGICAYVPQAAWLRNASIKENILFNLPLDEERYRKTLEACALVSDLQIIEDGDDAEIGERGVNLSGGQKARVSLARAVYSRASTLFLDDVLSAVDAHTAHHLFNNCLKGDLMKGRTLILVSHHVQMCAPGAKYIVALDNGTVQYEGGKDQFLSSSVMSSLIQSQADKPSEEKQEPAIEDLVDPQEKSPKASGEASSETSTAISPASTPPTERKKPRKLMEEEKRAVGRISKDVWTTYLKACGGPFYWSIFAFALLISTLVPVADNGWLKVWSGASPEDARDPTFYIGVYTAITLSGLVITTSRWFALYRGSIHASIILYERLLETVLFANLRFHDTVSRGRLLNRFGKDFEGIDSSLSDNLGRSTMYLLSTLTTFVTLIYIGGWPFFALILVLSLFYARIARVYSQTSRDMRRLDSVTRSPLYSIYGETISGVTVLRAFGASSKFLRDMLRNLDTNSCSYYWMWGGKQINPS